MAQIVPILKPSTVRGSPGAVNMGIDKVSECVILLKNRRHVEFTSLIISFLMITTCYPEICLPDY